MLCLSLLLLCFCIVFVLFCPKLTLALIFARQKWWYLLHGEKSPHFWAVIRIYAHLKSLWPPQSHTRRYSPCLQYHAIAPFSSQWLILSLSLTEGWQEKWTVLLGNFCLLESSVNGGRDPMQLQEIIVDFQADKRFWFFFFFFRSYIFSKDFWRKHKISRVFFCENGVL